ncbi:MAG: aminodeoxychorismate synthase component I, partial [Gammaproteobacteria bacterium]
HSPKDRAENLMIVDLLRNDLGRVCLPGSIGVETLFDVQSFATVHHLVSTISGELSPALNGFDLLANSFPGGSITGAPKRRAMQIIAELEPHPRQIFCGSLFFLSAHGVMDSNILIRSLLAENGEISAWAGGGLVADSVQSEEYSECFHKIIPLLEQLESLFFCVENCQNFKK